MGTDWYQRDGAGGIVKERKRLDRLHGAPRFWLPINEKRDIVFIDDRPIGIYEHNPKIRGKWRNWMTCMQGVVERPPCCNVLGPETRYYVGFYTIVQCSPWVDKGGNEHQYELELLAAKLTTMEKLEAKRVERDDTGGLVGCMYTARRFKSKDPSVGSEHEFKRQVEMAKMLPLVRYKGTPLTEMYRLASMSDEQMERLGRIFQVELDEEGKIEQKIVPFNYYELLKPMEVDEMRIQLEGADLDVHKKGGGGRTKVQPDVPF